MRIWYLIIMNDMKCCKSVQADRWNVALELQYTAVPDMLDQTLQVLFCSNLGKTIGFQTQFFM